MKIGIAFYHDNCEKYATAWIEECIESLLTQKIWATEHNVQFYPFNYAKNATVQFSLPALVSQPYRFDQCVNYAEAMNKVYAWIFETCDIAVNVNVDDWYHPDRITRLIRETEYDIVSSNYILVQDGVTAHTKFDELNVAEELLRGNNIVSNPCHIMKKRVFDALKFNPALVPVEDLDYWQFCLLKGFTIKIVPEYLHYYRIHKYQSGNR